MKELENERLAFEAHILAIDPRHADERLLRHTDKTWAGSDEHMPTFRDKWTQGLWTGWKMRAALAAPARPARPGWPARPAPERKPMTDEEVIDLVRECGLDWHKGFMPLFDDDPTNRFAVLVSAVEAFHGILLTPKEK